MQKSGVSKTQDQDGSLWVEKQVHGPVFGTVGMTEKATLGILKMKKMLFGSH